MVYISASVRKRQPCTRAYRVTSNVKKFYDVGWGNIRPIVVKRRRSPQPPFKKRFAFFEPPRFKHAKFLMNF